MAPVVLRRVHASFSGQESAPISMQVQDMVQRAGCEFTAIHFAQTADWFEIWSKKAKEAKVVIIFYSDIYRGRFTVALKREAELIIELEGQGRIKAFVFDPTKASASDILVNLQDDAGFMGDLPAFKRFVANTTPVDVDGGASAKAQAQAEAKQEASHADGGASMNLVVAATEVDFSSTENPLPKSPAKKEKAAGEGVAGYTMDRRAEEYGLQKR